MISNTLQKLGALIALGADALSFRELIGSPRDASCDRIWQFVQGATQRQLQAYDRQFVMHTLSLVDPDYRIRAMELYAYFKQCESARAGEFRGFITSGNAI